MRSSSRQSHIAQVRGVVHKQLGDNVVAQQINYLCISRRENLCERSGKGETCNYVLVSYYAY
jgi:hypothetical protein